MISMPYVARNAVETIYAIWGTEKNRRVNSFDSMAQAFALISATMNRLGEAGIQAWILVRLSPSDEDRHTIASGKALGNIVREYARRKNS